MKKLKTLIIICCVALLFCAVGVTIHFLDIRNTKILYESGASGEMTAVLPGVGRYQTFEFTVILPKWKNRSYALKIHEVSFIGGSLDFAGMNNGEWEFSLDDGPWLPIILRNGECVFQTSTSAGKHTLSLRATDSLHLDAMGGQLSFQLKLAREK